MVDTMNAATCYAVTSIFFSLCVITAGLRFYTRLCILGKFSADDYMLLVGFILLIPYTGLYLKVIYYLFYRPYLEYTLQNLSNVFKFAFIMMPFYLVASLFVKMSIALRVLKFTGEAPILRWIIITVITLYSADIIVMIAINLTQCLPHFYRWAPPLKVAWGPQCVRPVGIRISNWIFSALTCLVDFTLAIVPWFIVRKLWTTSRRTRILLSVLLGLGSIASLATIARMFYTYKYSSYPSPTTAGNFFIWLYLELTLATMACCAATLKPLVIKFIRGRTTVGSSDPRATEKTDASNWSTYVRQYFVRGGAEVSDRRRISLPVAVSRPKWPPNLQHSTTPRVLRRPTSLESTKEPANNQRFLGIFRQPTTRNTAQFTDTFASSDSQDESDDPARDKRASAAFESLEAEINYALQDDEDRTSYDVSSLSQDSR